MYMYVVEGDGGVLTWRYRRCGLCSHSKTAAAWSGFPPLLSLCHSRSLSIESFRYLVPRPTRTKRATLYVWAWRKVPPGMTMSHVHETLNRSVCDSSRVSFGGTSAQELHMTHGRSTYATHHSKQGSLGGPSSDGVRVFGCRVARSPPRCSELGCLTSRGPPESDKAKEGRIYWPAV